MIPQGWLLAGGSLAYPPKEISCKFPPNAQVASRFNPVHVKRLNCRIPCHFEAAPLKRLDTRIRSRKYHPSPGKLLTILRSGYADTQWKTWIPGYVDTRTSHMGTGYQLRVTYFKMLCRICKIQSSREKQATNIIFFVL